MVPSQGHQLVDNPALLLPRRAQRTAAGSLPMIPPAKWTATDHQPASLDDGQATRPMIPAVGCAESTIRPLARILGRREFHRSSLAGIRRVVDDRQLPLAVQPLDSFPGLTLGRTRFLHGIDPGRATRRPPRRRPARARFSSSSTFRRLASETSRPPYFESVELIPCRRQISATASPAWCSSRMPMICFLAEPALAHRPSPSSDGLWL
jgi:hypothetical protein